MSVSPKNSNSSDGCTTTKGKRSLNCSLRKYVPIVQWLPKYTRLDGISDMVAGITLGLTMIPQSIAYAALAGLTAQYGLYSCLLGGFVYLFFGTIREVSIGPTSLMALLTLEYTRNMPVEFVILLTFLAGCIELMMGMLNLGFVVDFISIPVTSGFISATSVIIIIAQLQGLLGLRFKAHNMVDNILKIFYNIEHVRIPDLILGCCSILFLLAFRKLKDLDCGCLKTGQSDGKNAKHNTVKKILWFFSICRNALVILIASLISFHLESVEGEAPFILSGKVDPGLPGISLPPFSAKHGNDTYTFLDMCAHYGAGIVVLPVISVLANVAIAKAFICGTTVNATQEMLTLGMCNLFGSFVSSMPTTGAFTRSAVSTASGVRTPMSGLYTGIMSILALSFLTPYFYYIPRSTLAAVLISAVVFMIDIDTIKLLWKGSKRDATAAIATFFVCIICGVEVGLLLGAFFNLIFFMRPSARPFIKVTQCKTQVGRRYVALRPETGLHYPAVDYFCNKIIKAVGKYWDGGNTNMPIVIECDSIRTMDYTAIKGIQDLLKDINSETTKVYFRHLSPDIIKSINVLANIKHFHFIESDEDISQIFYGKLSNENAEGDCTMKLLRNEEQMTETSISIDKEQIIDRSSKDESPAAVTKANH